MGDIIYYDLDSARQHSYKEISLGVAPSGELHEGTLITILNAFLIAKGTSADISVKLMDLDYDPQRGHSIRFLSSSSSLFTF